MIGRFAPYAGGRPPASRLCDAAVGDRGYRGFPEVVTAPCVRRALKRAVAKGRRAAAKAAIRRDLAALD